MRWSYSLIRLNFQYWKSKYMVLATQIGLYFSLESLELRTLCVQHERWGWDDRGEKEKDFQGNRNHVHDSGLRFWPDKPCHRSVLPFPRRILRGGTKQGAWRRGMKRPFLSLLVREIFLMLGFGAMMCVRSFGPSCFLIGALFFFLSWYFSNKL